MNELDIPHAYYRVTFRATNEKTRKREVISLLVRSDDLGENLNFGYIKNVKIIKTITNNTGYKFDQENLSNVNWALKQMRVTNTYLFREDDSVMLSDGDIYLGVFDTDSDALLFYEVAESTSLYESHYWFYGYF